MTPEEHEARSEKLADAIRKALGALAVGGLAGAVILRGPPAQGHWHAAMALFGGAIAALVVSLFLAKHRALRRRDAALVKGDAPAFGLLARSWTWDCAAAGLTFAGSIVLWAGFRG